VALFQYVNPIKTKSGKSGLTQRGEIQRQVGAIPGEHPGRPRWLRRRLGDLEQPFFKNSKHDLRVTALRLGEDRLWFVRQEKLPRALRCVGVISRSRRFKVNPITL
jgi:hypothetical protein